MYFFYAYVRIKSSSLCLILLCVCCDVRQSVHGHVLNELATHIEAAEFRNLKMSTHTGRHSSRSHSDVGGSDNSTECVSLVTYGQLDGCDADSNKSGSKSANNNCGIDLDSSNNNSGSTTGSGSSGMDEEGTTRTK